MEIHDVQFRGSALRRADRPREWFPQVAVAGRSNVGKSSLLNWLLRRNVAKVAKSPGKTRALNFFLVNRSFFVVDLPGYGYAKVARDLRNQWGRELARYLVEEERLAGVMSLIDVRHEPSNQDMELQSLLLETQRPRLVVLTKADKVGRSARRQRQHEVQHRLGLATPPPVVSVQTGEGRREVLAGIELLVTEWRERNTGDTNGKEEEDR